MEEPDDALEEAFVNFAAPFAKVFGLRFRLGFGLGIRVAGIFRLRRTIVIVFGHGYKRFVFAANRDAVPLCLRAGVIYFC